MEHRLNSKPDTSAVFSKSESPIPSLTEYYILTRAINHWDETKYVTYSTKEASLQYFIIHDWPHVLEPAASALSDASFSFTGKIRPIF